MNTLTVSCLLLACALHHVNARVTEVSGNLTIFGGHPVNITDVPFMAMFMKSGFSEWCGASIVRPQFVVSACHCIDMYDDPVSNYDIRVGSDILNGGQRYEIEEFFKHPKHHRFNDDYDVLVIKLQEKLIFNERVQPIKMAGPGLVLKDGEILDTMGFGITERNDIEPSEKLLKVDLPYFAHDKCKALFHKIYNVDITDRMICAGGRKGKDSAGDIGGPLRYKNQLVGIVLSGGGRDRKRLPSLYTRVSAVRDFIDDVIKNNK